MQRVFSSHPFCLRAILFFLVQCLAGSAFATIYHVKPTGNDSNNGTSWATSFSTLQKALQVAASGDEIWVATGTYVPTTTSDRTISFVMKNGVGIYGGFPASGNPGFGDRNWINYPTTLSGGGTAYHVISNFFNSLDNSAILDGFGVTGGNANGGGFSETAGGGAYNYSSSPQFRNCSFYSNSVTGVGGGFYSSQASPILLNCSFIQNTAGSGGGITMSYSSTTLNNCSFYANSGGLYGGGAYIANASVNFTNCTFSGNGANYGGGIATTGSAAGTLTNCILWGDNNEINTQDGGSVSVTYSIIGGGYSGTGNLNVNPLFVSTTNLRLQTCSPAINTGSNAAVTASIDLDGNTRIYDNTVDRGAYEYQGITPVLAASCKNITVNIGSNGTATVNPADINNNSTGCGSVSYLINNAASLALDCSQIGTPQTATLKVTDASALSASCTSTITVADNTKPTVVCKDITINLDGSGSAGFLPVAVLQSSADNCGTVNIVSAVPSDFTCSNVGNNNVTLTVSDDHNNTSTCTAIVTVQDVVLPSVSCNYNLTVSLDANGTATVNASDILLSASDNCGTVNVLPFTPVTYTCSDLGYQVPRVDVNDGHGNSNYCAPLVTVVDALAPTVVCKNAAINLNDSGTATLNPADVFQSGTDNCGTVNPASVSPNTFDCSNLGANNVTLTVNDGHGNTNTCTAIVTVSDKRSPIVACKDATINLDANGTGTITTAAVFQSGSDNCGTVNQVSVTPNLFTCNDLGNHTVVLTVNDGHGNINICTATVTVADNLAPTVVCKNATLNLSSAGNATLNAANVFQSGMDNCGTVNQVSVTPNSFNCLNIGTNNVTLTVNDGHGNSNTCTATVTIADITAPVIVCKSATINLAANGTGSVIPITLLQSASDCGGIHIVSAVPASFTCSNIGNNTVLLTVSDDYNNTTTCTTTVTVTDDNHACAPLPVELVAFKAIAEKEAIQLTWETASEHNNAGFQVERSENGRDFEKIAFIAGAGISAEKHSYQLKDQDIRAGQRYFYRLQQIDYDGTAQYSDIVQAMLSNGKMTLAVFPNPAATNSVIQLQIQLPQASEVLLALFNVQGKLIRTEQHDLEADLQILELPINDLPANAYFLKVTANGESVYQQLIVTR